MEILKYIFRSLMLLLSSILLTALATGCKSNQSDAFVTIEKNGFSRSGEAFFPLMLNYVVEFRYSKNQYFISPLKAYEIDEQFEHNDSILTANQLRGHFRLIREMGFNSIRVCLDRLDSVNTKFYYPAGYRPLLIEDDHDIILNCMSDLIQIAGEEKLQVMMLIKAPYEVDAIIEFTKLLLERFKNNPTIFAYDFFNEPIYFDRQHDREGNAYERPKTEAAEIADGWRNLMDEFAPHQLFTIGFSEPIEVFEWDPSMLDVDFLCFHTYHPLRVPNEIYWFANYTKKPWMIGETSLPADDSIVSYADQELFFSDVLQRVKNCNGIGLGWWEFQEIPGAHFEAQYAGILSREGVTKTKDGKFSILGTPKPVVNSIRKAASIPKSDACDCMVNYQNIVGYTNYLLSGSVFDFDSGLPIEGAVIRGWNENWTVGLNSFTLNDGSFKLFSNDKCFHYEISAPGYSRFRFDKTIEFLPVTQQPVLNNVYLEYQQIKYHPFIDREKLPRSLFNLKSNLFNSFKFISVLPPIKLKKL